MQTVTLEQAMHLLQAGHIGVLPTDTLMGVVGSAHNREAVNRLYRLKDRQKKPGTLIAATLEQLVQLGLKRRYLVVGQQYWPGPVSVVVPCASNEMAYLHLGKQSLAVRIPRSDFLVQLLEQTGPLLSTSANMPGKPPATQASEAYAYFGESVDFYVEPHQAMLHEPSTVVQVVDDNVVVLRQGAVTIDSQTGAIQP